MTSASAISRGGERLKVCLVLCAKITENAEKGGGERGSHWDVENMIIWS